MLIKERSIEKQVCTTIVTSTLNTVIDDQFASGTGGYIILSASTALSNSAGKLKVDKAGGAGTIGCYKDFVAISGTVYTLNFDFDKGTLSPTHSVIVEVIDLTTSSIVFTSPAITATGSYGTYNFTAATSGSYRLRFTRMGPPSNKHFFLDNIKITYTTAVSNTTCITASEYRYGFNGKEKDNEVKGVGNSYDFGARFHDPRLGRWLTIDPFASKYPALSSYNYCANSPFIFLDPNGDIIIIHYENPDGSKGEIEYKPGHGYVGDNKYVIAAFTSLDEASKYGGRRKLMRLANSKKVVNIYDQPLYAGTNIKSPYFDYPHALKTGEINVYWNPQAGAEETDRSGNGTGKHYAPGRFLFHELLHTYHYIFGKLFMRIRKSLTGGKRWHDLEEKKTIKEENKIYSDDDSKGGVRTSHRGKGEIFNKPTVDPNYVDPNDVNRIPQTRPPTKEEMQIMKGRV